jgi:hypothetical protein
MTPTAFENSRKIRRLLAAVDLRGRIEDLPEPEWDYVSSTKKSYAWLREEWELATADKKRKHPFCEIFPSDRGNTDFYDWAEKVYGNLSSVIHGHKLVEDLRSLVRGANAGRVLTNRVRFYLACNGSFDLVEGDFTAVERVRYQALSNLLDRRGEEGIYQQDYNLQSKEVRTLVAALENVGKVENWSRYRSKKRTPGREVSIPGKRARR